MHLVSVITVNYNQPLVTEELLQSLFTTNCYPAIEIIVVDNGSTINAVPDWRVKYPTVKFIRSEKNLGFAGGNNLGIRAAKGDYLLLVNNDTEVTQNLISLLAQTLDLHEKVGIVSPKILFHFAPDTLQYAGFSTMNYITGRNSGIGYFEKDTGQYDGLSGSTGYAHGAAMMVKREAMEKAGLMAENFFLYYEELDWCERIKKKGYEIWVNMQAEIYHKESISVGKNSALKEYYMNRNRILFMRKHASYKYPLFLAYFILLVFPRNVLNYIKDKRYRFVGLLLKALVWNFTNSTDSNRLFFPAVNSSK